MRFENHKNFEDIGQEFLLDYERNRELNNIQEFESRSMSSTQRRQTSYGDLIDIPFGYDDHGY